MQVATFLAYLAAAALFIVGIRRLRTPETARSGNTIAAVGMAIALIATLFVIRFESLLLIGAAVILGSVVGAVSAQRVQMTAMPQLMTRPPGAERRMTAPAIPLCTSGCPNPAPGPPTTSLRCSRRWTTW